MKKGLIMTLGAALLLISCGTYTETGAYTGATFGQVLGSAIGGISGGWRGEHAGALIGTVGGAIVGAAIGSAADDARQKRYEERARQREQRRQADYGNRDYSYGNQDYSGLDDRIDFDTSDSEPLANAGTTPELRVSDYSVPAIEIRNARIQDANGDGVLKRGEECKVVFEIMNNSDRPVRNIQPQVTDISGNKHVNVSPNLLVESIPPHQGVRYTATILADRRLKDGEITLRIGVAEGNRQISSQTRELTVPTRKQ